MDIEVGYLLPVLLAACAFLACRVFYVLAIYGPYWSVSRINAIGFAMNILRCGGDFE
jgi:hypothetical protein